MTDTQLRQALLNASVQQHALVIDWLQRPWAPAKNDALRGGWHEARRSHGARRALAYAIEQEIHDLASAERDVAHVAARLGVAEPTADAVARAITQRLGAAPPVSIPPSITPAPALAGCGSASGGSGISPDVVATVLRVASEVALRLLRDKSGHHRGHRRHRHGRS